MHDGIRIARVHKAPPVAAHRRRQPLFGRGVELEGIAKGEGQGQGKGEGTSCSACYTSWANLEWYTFEEEVSCDWLMVESLDFFGAKKIAVRYSQQHIVPSLCHPLCSEEFRRFWPP